MPNVMSSDGGNEDIHMGGLPIEPLISLCHGEGLYCKVSSYGEKAVIYSFSF